MDLSTRCLNYLTRRTTGNTARIRDIIGGFCHDVLRSSRTEVWSSVFEEGEDELYTDTHHGDRNGAVVKPFSLVLTRDQVTGRAADQQLLEVNIDQSATRGPRPAARLLILFQAEASLGEDDLKLLERALGRLVEQAVQLSTGRLHEAIVEAAHHSKDLTSFLHRLIQTVIIPEFQFTGVSIFYHEQKTRSLILGATTGIARQETLGIKRSDVRYFTDSSSFTARCWREGREIVENVFRTRPLKHNTLGETAAEIQSRIYLPLRRWAGRSLSERTSPIGVVRAINANRDSNYHPVTVLEAARLRILCDAASVITERYVRAVSILHDQERATHGYNTDLAAIRYAAQNVQRWLGRAEQEDVAPAQRELALQEIKYRIRDILAVQDNMASQIITVMHHAGSSRLVSKDSDALACGQPFTDVIMRLVAAKKGMSECYGRRELRLTFAGSTKADEAFIKIPALKISVGNLYLVFRNLAENSIKYSRKGLIPQLDVSWSAAGGFVEFRFIDQGIGIPQHEHHLVLREGFRGREAQELQLRGNGLGLAVSRAAVEAVGGSLAFDPPLQGVPGACFVLRLPV